MKEQLTKKFTLCLLILLFMALIACDTGSVTEISTGSDDPVQCLLQIGTASDSSGSGTVSSSTGESYAFYDLGTAIQVEALADDSSSFLGWFDRENGGKMVSPDAVYSFTLDGYLELYAKFGSGSDRCAVSPQISGDSRAGTISTTPLAAGGSYPKGSTVTLKVVPGMGFIFKGWSESPGGETTLSEELEYSFLLEKNSIIYATFELKVIEFPDPVLEKVIRYKISKPTGPLNYFDLYRIESLSDADRNDALYHTNDDIYRQKIKTLNGLEYLTSLKTVGFGYHEIVDLSPLKDLTKLTNLSLSSNKISSIAALQNLTNLTRLELENNLISDTGPLLNLSSLKYLNMNKNSIVKCDGLVNMKDITELYLNENNIDDISGLSNMYYLRIVELNSNQISDISVLNNPSSLSRVQLENNNIGNIEVLKKHASMQQLSLNGNNIADISSLSQLVFLEFLDLSYTGVSDLTPLKGLNNIYGLSLKGNGLTDLTPLVENSGLDNEDYLDIAGNPDIPEAQLQTLSDRGVRIMRL